jgi:hypothetical protein
MVSVKVVKKETKKTKPTWYVLIVLVFVFVSIIHHALIIVLVTHNALVVVLIVINVVLDRCREWGGQK